MPKFATIGIGCESLKMLKNSKRSSLSAEKSLGGKKARGAARRGAARTFSAPPREGKIWQNII